MVGLNSILREAWLTSQQTEDIRSSFSHQRPPRLSPGPICALMAVQLPVYKAEIFQHPHLSGSSAGFWPFQVTSAADAGRQEGVLAAIVELELHQRIFETD